MIFWNLLKVAKDKITTVECKGILRAGDRSLSTHGASIYVSAKKISATCWELTKQDGPDWTKVYLLNYSPKRVTCVPREAYENDHDFFITVELSGCRFTITDHSVLHIAADVGAAYEAGNVRRDKAEHLALDRKTPNLRRRVSVTERPGTQFYVGLKGERLAEIAKNALIRAWPENIYAAKTLWTLSKSYSASPDAIIRITNSVINLAIAENKSRDDATRIAEEVKVVLEHELPTLIRMTTGAFIVGIKTDSIWKYFALIDGHWSDIDPVPLSSSSSAD